MKICLVSRVFNKNSGSAEWIYADRLKEELSKKKFGVYTIEQKGASTFSSGFKKIVHDFIRIPYKIVYYRIVNQVKLFQFINENQAIYSFLARTIGAKTSTYFHDLMRIREKKLSLYYLYFLFVYKMASLSNIIICNSSLTKKDFIKKYKKDENKVKIIPCVHYNNLYPLKKSKKSLGKIGYLGGLIERKRPLKLINMALEIKKRKSDLKIDIWGKGYLKESIKKLIKKEKLNGIVQLNGFAPYEETNKIYNSFDFFVFPTEEEGLGLPIIEAMMCGVPIFILKDAILPQEIREKCIVCKDEKEILKKMERIRKSKKRYDSESKKTFENSKKFDFETNLNKLIQVYMEL